MQNRFCTRVQSILGTALLGLGTFVFYEHVTRTAAELSRLLRTVPSEGAGEQPTLVVAAIRVCQAFSAHHQPLLHSLFQPTLVLSWPLLLVTVGTVLSRESFRG